MNRTPSADRIHTYVMEGLLKDVVQAREAYSLMRTLGEHSDSLGKSTYGHFFAALDRALLNHYLLAIARMYDKHSTRNEIRSIPAALTYMSAWKEEFPIRERYSLEVRLEHAGLPRHDTQHLPERELTERVLSFFTARLPSSDANATDSLSRALMAVRTRRDKRIAHSEHFPVEAFPAASWGEVEALVRFAEDVLSCISFGYLSLVLTDDSGVFMLGDDAARASRAFERLLAAAEVIPPKHRVR